MYFVTRCGTLGHVVTLSVTEMGLSVVGAGCWSTLPDTVILDGLAGWGTQ